MLIFLLGYMGSGKTTVGRKLADRLGYRFADMDDIFEDQQQTSILEYFKEFGEEGFRIKEREILHSFLDQDNIVIATGGGTPCFFDNMEVMNRVGETVYLKVEFEVIYERIKNDDKTRPLLNGIEPAILTKYIEHNIQVREAYYLRSSMIFDFNHQNIENLIRKITDHEA